MAKEKKSTPQKRTLILWALLSRENGCAFQSELRPEPDKADRAALEADGLIRWEKKRGQRIWIEATDRGWDWAQRNLGSPLPANSPAAGEILRTWLTRLQAFLEARNYALADVLGQQKLPEPDNAEAGTEKGAAPSLNDAPPPATSNEASLRKKIRQAYLAISQGRLNTRVLLRDLRTKLRDVGRRELDAALVEMQRDQEALLYQLDNRIEITDADRAAAIYFGDEPRHILWIER